VTSEASAGPTLIVTSEAWADPRVTAAILRAIAAKAAATAMLRASMDPGDERWQVLDQRLALYAEVVDKLSSVADDPVLTGEFNRIAVKLVVGQRQPTCWRPLGAAVRRTRMTCPRARSGLRSGRPRRRTTRSSSRAGPDDDSGPGEPPGALAWGRAASCQLALCPQGGGA
jgi:hypothetical protein